MSHFFVLLGLCCLPFEFGQKYCGVCPRECCRVILYIDVCVSSLGLCLSAKHFCVFAVKHVTQSFSPIRI